MDMRMPRVDGITATRRLRARPHPPEVIVLTTFDADENILHALRAGASGFLLKDTPPGQIVEAVPGSPPASRSCPRLTRRLMDRAATQAGATSGPAPRWPPSARASTTWSSPSPRADQRRDRRASSP